MRLRGKDVGACLQAIQCFVPQRAILIACKQAPTKNLGSSHLDCELELAVHQEPLIDRVD
jgi:hypothetical protein